MGKEEDISDYNKTVIPFLIKEIDKHIPTILCSDNHDVKNYSPKQNLWIKADLTFEGLKQILFEPEHRVKIQKEEPDLKEDRLVIESVRFISSNSRFTPEVIYLNKNLNVIIGGKSSGKSILLYCIAKTLVSDKDFFIKENIEDKYKFRQDDLEFNFEVTIKSKLTQNLYRPESENSLISEVKYIPQNYLVELAEPQINKKGATLNKIVRELIKEDGESRRKYENFIDTVKGLDRLREGIIDDYFQLKEKDQSLHEQLRSKPNVEALTQSIASNTQKVDDLNKSVGLTPEQINEYNNLQTKSKDNKAAQDIINEDFKKIRDFNRDIKAGLNSLLEKYELTVEALGNEQLKLVFSEQFKLIKELRNGAVDFDKFFEFTKNEDGSVVFATEGDISKLIHDKRRESDELDEALKFFQENEAIKKQLAILGESIKKDSMALREIEQLNNEIKENTIAINHRKEKLFEILNESYYEYEKISEALKDRIVNLQQDGLKITGIPKYNFPKLRDTLYQISDGRSASYLKYDILKEEHDGLTEFKRLERYAELSTIFDAIINNEYALSKRIDTKTAIKKLLDDYFYDYWEIEYKGDKLGEMSTGKACFVILMLIIGLSKSKSPILIDQPEDNLDNRSITSELVTYLRNKKLERQIIVVTHNPNIVVNADAENVIVANQKGQNDLQTSSLYQFDYINGSIENTFAQNTNEKDVLKSMGIREHIAEVVEGGKEAFLKRERKYGFLNSSGSKI